MNVTLEPSNVKPTSPAIPAARGDESACVKALVATLAPFDEPRRRAVADAVELIKRLRADHAPGMMESLLGEYGLDTDEGVALMCLAEAYLRTPDAETLDALISDKIGDADWARHLGHAKSSLVNASTWALMLTGRVYKQIPADARDLGSAMHGLVQRLGEPVVRTAVAQAMKMLGQQFVLGSSIETAIANGKREHAKGKPGAILHSFDMLGEAARTMEDAERYFAAYADAIRAIARSVTSRDVHANNSISVKLSALHPRYETVKRTRVMGELAPRLRALALMAKNAGIGLSVDAEEADRLELSLDVMETCLADPALAGWDGFGAVVQAYSKRAPAVLDRLYADAARHDRRIAIRLVKGAYWDTEVKLAQVMGLDGYPVYTRKEHTDIAYLACAVKLLGMADRVYPQFATHNALTVTTIEAIARAHFPDAAFEFQRLHGMGAPLHEMAQATDSRRRRIYAPVGVHRDLLAYLVRRLLENGANSSFVNQIVDSAVPPERIAEDPIEKAERHGFSAHPAIALPSQLFGDRKNSSGANLNEPCDMVRLEALIRPHLTTALKASTVGIPVRNPAKAAEIVGHRLDTNVAEAKAALDRAIKAQAGWCALAASDRADLLERAADLYEANGGELMALAIREAGKTWSDALGELREAVDFLRYYAAEARNLDPSATSLGSVVSIAPWNFPLAIFTGQFAAALAAGNTVIAKPAEQTPLIAARAVSLLHEAGVPNDVLQIVQGDGAEIGPVLTGDSRIDGVIFTGSTETAKRIDRHLAGEGNAEALLVAETGGLNAMIVDSTALLEQATRDIVASAFQSAGQRCSALRLLCVQEDIAEPLIEMVAGAMAELAIGDPADPATDIGPVINAEAREGILAHCSRLEADGRLLFKCVLPASASDGHFVAPHMFRLDRVEDLTREIFGPVLHVVTFKATELDHVIDRINATGFGLTFAMHSRIDTRVDHVCARVQAGNIYVNRNQIGAVVGVQPFGGEGLSGTGPKAGGPLYLQRLLKSGGGAGRLKDAMALPGPTGERNTYRHEARHAVLCCGPSANDVARQVKRAEALGCEARAMPDVTALSADQIEKSGAQLALYDGDDWRSLRQRLAASNGPLVAVERSDAPDHRFMVERTVSEDTTASGGNASLLAAVV